MTDKLHDEARPAAFDPSADGWERDVTTPFTSLVGPIWRRRRDGLFTTGMLCQARHANARGVVDTGVVLTFADHAVGVAAAHLFESDAQVTIQLNTLFVDDVRVGDFLEGRSEVVGTGSSLVFVRGVLTAGARTVAISEGVWKIVRRLP